MSLERLINKLEALDLNRVVKDSLQGQEEFIIELNTQGQLFDKGIDSQGISLEDIGGPYSPFTITLKQGKGQPTDRITLKDTGEFYQTFKVRIGNDEFEITADPIKEDTNLFAEWGEDIVGLNEESLDKLLNVILPKIQQGIRRSIL